MSADDLACLLAMRAQLMRAQTVVNVIENYMAGRYQLGPRDRIATDGTIDRALTETRC